MSVSLARMARGHCEKCGKRPGRRWQCPRCGRRVGPCCGRPLDLLGLGPAAAEPWRCHCCALGMFIEKLSATVAGNVLDCLGPAFSSMKWASRKLRNSANARYLPDEILKWHCVNTQLLTQPHLQTPESLVPKLMCIGKLWQKRCYQCKERVRQRQMYRWNYSLGGNWYGTSYYCCYCIHEEIRRFLIGDHGLLLRAGFGTQLRARLVMALLSRMRHPRGGILDQCLALLR